MKISSSELKPKFVGEEIAIAKQLNKTEEEIIEENIEAQAKLTDSERNN